MRLIKLLPVSLTGWAPLLRRLLFLYYVVLHWRVLNYLSAEVNVLLAGGCDLSVLLSVCLVICLSCDLSVLLSVCLVICLFYLCNGLLRCSGIMEWQIWEMASYT